MADYDKAPSIMDFVLEALGLRPKITIDPFQGANKIKLPPIHEGRQQAMMERRYVDAIQDPAQRMLHQAAIEDPNRSVADFSDRRGGGFWEPPDKKKSRFR